MLKTLTLLALTTVIFIQTVPGFCGSKTMSFKVSATIPAHVIANSNLSATPFSNNSNQLVQTQTVVRNNRSISLTSIVVP